MKYLAVTLAVIFMTAISQAATVHVPGDYATVQEGIDAASNHDVVLVGPGVYYETIDFKGKALTVESLEGSEETFLDGSQSINPDLNSVVSFVNGEGEESVLKGFTIRNGTGTSYELYPSYFYRCGGGVFCINTSSPPCVRIVVAKTDSLLGGAARSGALGGAQA